MPPRLRFSKDDSNHPAHQAMPPKTPSSSQDEDLPPFKSTPKFTNRLTHMHTQQLLSQGRSTTSHPWTPIESHIPPYRDLPTKKDELDLTSNMLKSYKTFEACISTARFRRAAHQDTELVSPKFVPVSSRTSCLPRLRQ